MKTKRRIGLAVLALLAGSVAMPGAVAADDLPEALAAAYDNNPTLLAKRAELRAIDEGVPQALSGWRPTVTATGNLAYEYSNTVTTAAVPPSVKGDNVDRGVSVTIRQPLFRGFRTVAGTSRAENDVQAGRAELMVTEQQVLLDAVTAYMDVLSDQSVVELNANNVQVLRSQLDATGDRFEVGELTRTDVAQAESRYARAIADRVRAEGDLETSRATYVRIVGIPPTGLSQPAPIAGLPNDLGGVKAQAGLSNPSVIAASFREQSADDNVDVVAGELLPTVNLAAQYGIFDDPSVTTTNQESASIGAEISVPIYQAGSVSSRVREAKQVVSQRRLQIIEARRLAIENATQSWETLAAARAQVQALEEQVRSTRIALEGVEEEAQAGLRTVLDILDAEQEYLDARVSLVSARRDEVVASYGVLAAIGGLTAQNLGLPVAYYDPSEHYNEVRNKIWGTGDDPVLPVGD